MLFHFADIIASGALAIYRQENAIVKTTLLGSSVYAVVFTKSKFKVS